MREVVKIYDRTVGARLSSIILFVLIMSVAFFGWEYYHGKLEEHTTALYGGLIASLIAVTIQMLMEWNEHRDAEKFKKMGIAQILPNRDHKKEYYYEILRSAKKRVDFMGTTAYSFLDDFAKEEGAGEKSSVLIKALKNNVAVRILVPKKDLLGLDKHTKHDDAAKIMDGLKDKYSDYFSFEYLEQMPAYTLVMADDECILGTIIPGVKSDVTSAVHAFTSSPFLKCYLDHYNASWKKIEDAMQKA